MSANVNGLNSMIFPLIPVTIRIFNLTFEARHGNSSLFFVLEVKRCFYLCANCCAVQTDPVLRVREVRNSVTQCKRKRVRFCKALNDVSVIPSVSTTQPFDVQTTKVKRMDMREKSNERIFMCVFLFLLRKFWVWYTLFDGLSIKKVLIMRVVSKLSGIEDFSAMQRKKVH
ncbi:hypothetical protein DICVIV_01945 [Dictyocaulus viviparus]|uniref:Uncharacterized protein n=1 Tax=Dictyocaulus viviparus TaxID=29172 RepID=A0A0D8YBD6_DICVI|nr:hypothetical protein DICVIV_01945 [Dictyocaulus viviparus]